MGKYILAHDLGTSGNKSSLYDSNGNLIESTVYEYPIYYPEKKWVEQNPKEWWKAVCITTQNLLKKTSITKKEVLAVSFSAQMMGCLLIDKDGEPLRNMITWADSRSGYEEKSMLSAISMKDAYNITGHRVTASYSAAKLLWVKNNEPEIYKKAFKMLQAKDYIILKLTGNIVTDYSDASGTNLLDIRKKVWSEELLTAWKIRKDLLPDIYRSTDIAGHVTKEAATASGLLEGTPVVLGGGDGSCACVGAGVIEEGSAYNVLGTSSWISSASQEPTFDKAMRVFNFVHLNDSLYAPCGTMQAAGLSYQWYKNTLCEIEQIKAKEKNKSVYSLIDEGITQIQPGSQGVLYLPYMLGERSPWWNLDARACFIGLSANTSKAVMARAILEGVGYNLRIILDTLKEKQNLKSIISIGGGAKSSVWLQILADIWQEDLLLPSHSEEATSMGAAICAGIGIGLYKDFKSCEHFNKITKKITANKDHKTLYENYYKIFKNSYTALLPIFSELTKMDG